MYKIKSKTQSIKHMNFKLGEDRRIVYVAEH